MQPKIIFQRLVQRDMDEILRHYAEEAGEIVATRFFQTFLKVVDKTLVNPAYHHPVSGVLRRADVPGFPYHFLFRQTASGIRILVLRHDRRHPAFGLRRK